MPKKPIPDILQNLEARLPEEAIPNVRVRPGLSTHTLILNTDDTTDIEILKQEGWIEGYVVLPKLDGPDDGYGNPTVSGYYISACVSRDQIIGMNQANQLYRLAERGAITAAVLQDFPPWAKSKDGYGPAHVFLGVDIPEDDGYL